MKSRTLFIISLVILLFTTPMTSPVSAADTQPFNISGLYVEGCSCSAPCGCELIGLEHGCQGVGAVSLTSGKYKGMDISGAKIVYAGVPSSWIKLYIDVKDPAKENAVKSFAEAAFGPMGKVESVKNAKIDIAGKNGKYSLSVDDGKIMKFESEPVLGGDKKTPVAHTNTNNLLVKTFLQAKTISATYSDGDRNFTLKDSNSYFNNKMKTAGKM